MNAVSSFTGHNDISTAIVDLTPCGHIVQLHFQDSQKYAGLVESAVMCKLLGNPSVELKATLTASVSKPSKAANAKNHKGYSINQCSVRVIINGLKQEESDIGRLLSSAALYLQHPTLIECNAGLEYRNPHYLVRPGHRLPELESLSISLDADENEPDAPLTAAEKLKLMQVFDSYIEPEAVSSITASLRLQTPLKRLARIVQE